MSPAGTAIRSMILAVTLFFSACGGNDQAHELSPQARYAWLHMQGNLLAQKRLLELGKLAPADTLITEVNLVDVTTGTIRRNVSVLVRNGRIDWIRDGVVTAASDGVTRINGANQYLAPGLTDMHVHTHDDADYLLHLAFGVTSIREMNGWPWRLKRRELLEAGKLLAPNMFIVSRILNSSDFGGYAIAVNTEEQARTAVREAASDGYDAIKTHNGLTNAVFMAIVDEAHSHGLEVVGHIPVRVKVTDAIKAGMHTAEHFKGYIDDSILEISEEDWLTPSIDMEMYLTPTFYAYREHQRGVAAQEVLDNSANMVLPHRHLAWQRYAEQEADELTRLRQTILPKSEEIFKTLLPHNIQWLAGTDSGGYELMVPGEALIEELEIMEDLGLTPLEALRSATTRAARAMNWTNRIGNIAPGMSADLILLEQNPLETVSNLRTLQAVMIRGIWLPDPASLIVNGESINRSDTSVDRQQFEDAVRLAEKHAAAGYAQSTLSLATWNRVAEEIGATDLADRLRALNE